MKEDNELLDKESADNKSNQIEPTTNTTNIKSKLKPKMEYTRPLLIITLIIIIINAILKLLIAYNITLFIFRNISSLYPNCLKFFPDKDVFLILYYIDFFFLVIGIIALFLEPLIHIYIRINFLVSDNKRLLYLICGKVMYFVVLGLVPEVAILMFKFNNKNNVVIPLFLLKIYSQPILLIALIIYGLFLLLSFKRSQIIFNFHSHLLIYFGVIKTIAKWSVFNWKVSKEEKEDGNDNDKEEEEDEDDDNEEDDEDLIPIKNKYLRLATVLSFIAIILSPLLNGIFDYGFLVFFFTHRITCLLFKLDILLSFVFSLLTIRLIQ